MQKKINQDALISNGGRGIKEPINKTRHTGKYGTRPKEIPKERNFRYCDAANWNPGHKCTARESICHKCNKKRHFAKACKFEHRNRQEIDEITEPEETEESDTDRSKNIITEIKRVTDQRNHITMTLKTDGTVKQITVDTGLPVTIIPLDEEIMKDKKDIKQKSRG